MPINYITYDLGDVDVTMDSEIVPETGRPPIGKAMRTHPTLYVDLSLLAFFYLLFLLLLLVVSLLYDLYVIVQTFCCCICLFFAFIVLI